MKNPIVHTKLSFKELNLILNEVKAKYPVGTVLNHKSNKCLEIKKESNFKVIFDSTFTFAQGIAYGRYFIWQDGRYIC